MHVLKTKLCFSSSNYTNVNIDVLTCVKGAKAMVFSRGVNIKSLVILDIEGGRSQFLFYLFIECVMNNQRTCLTADFSKYYNVAVLKLIG